MESGSRGRRPEAQRYLGIAEKLLTVRDLVGSKNFAVRAQETDAFVDGVDQIHAIIDVLLAAEKRINNHHDWYAILQLGNQSNDLELIKKKYRRLALLLHPDKNKKIFADNAFKLVVDAWAVLSNPSKKTLYDNELNLFSKLQNKPGKPSQKKKRKASKQQQNFNSGDSSRSPSSSSSSLMSTFWTTCPYCYNLYEYPRVYEECCLRCEKCKRAFHAVMVRSLPPTLPGKEDEFYCCWGVFPFAFSVSNSGNGPNGKPIFPGFPDWMPSPPTIPTPPSSTDKNAGFPNWMPFSPMFPSQSQGEGNRCATAAASAAAAAEVNLKAGEGKKYGDERTEAPNVTIAKPQMRKKTVAKRTQKQKGRGPQDRKVESKTAQESEMFDLNGELENEAKDSEPRTGDEDVVPAAGSGFFEGLDEFLGNLPILNIVDDDGKVEGGGDA